MSENLLRKVRFGDLLVTKSGTYVIVDCHPFDEFCKAIGFYSWRGGWSEQVTTRLRTWVSDGRSAIS